MRRRIVIIFFAVVLIVGRGEAGVIHIRGMADLKAGSLKAELRSGREGEAVVQYLRASDKYAQFLVQLKDWPAFFSDISTALEGDVTVFPGQEAAKVRYLIKMRSRYTLINQKPAGDFSGQFELRDQALIVHTLSAGAFFLQGDMDITPPFRLNLDLKLSQLELQEAARMISGNQDLLSEGTVSGNIHFFGTRDEMNFAGAVESYDGMLDTLVYRNLNIKFDGRYPDLRIFNSNISQTDGFSFSLLGNLNLSRMDTLARQIDALTKNPLIKSNSQETEWTLKRIESDARSGTTELKYLRRSKENINTMSEENSDLLGVEQKVKF